MKFKPVELQTLVGKAITKVEDGGFSFDFWLSDGRQITVFACNDGSVAVEEELP